MGAPSPLFPHPEVHVFLHPGWWNEAFPRFVCFDGLPKESMAIRKFDDQKLGMEVPWPLTWLEKSWELSSHITGRDVMSICQYPICIVTFTYSYTLFWIYNKKNYRYFFGIPPKHWLLLIFDLFLNQTNLFGLEVIGLVWFLLLGYLYGLVVLLMAEIRRLPVEVGSLPHCLRRVL